MQVFCWKGWFSPRWTRSFFGPKAKRVKGKAGATNYSCGKFYCKAIQSALGVTHYSEQTNNYMYTTVKKRDTLSQLHKHNKNLLFRHVRMYLNHRAFSQRWFIEAESGFITTDGSCGAQAFSRWPDAQNAFVWIGFSFFIKTLKWSCYCQILDNCLKYNINIHGELKGCKISSL